jgi:DNA (cytosine-5)-methyltransferase 1
VRFISLFSGIGGFDLGFERAGMECVAQVEIDEFCGKVLKKHWPDVPLWKDVRDVGKHNLPAAELICGGFPCQPFSNAGKRRGAEDDRYLWPEMLRVVSELKPTWFVGENVAGIINLALDTVLSDLESEGYTCETFVIPACAVNAPHRRDRVWIVAYSNSSRHVHGQSEINPTETRQQTLSKPIAGGPDISNTNSHGLPVTTRRQQRSVSEEKGALSRGEFSRGSAEEKQGNWWNVEPELGRVAHGIPDRVDRLKSLGNAVVPQVVEVLGKAIMEIDLLEGAG